MNFYIISKTISHLSLPQPPVLINLDKMLFGVLGDLDDRHEGGIRKGGINPIPFLPNRTSTSSSLFSYTSYAHLMFIMNYMCRI